MYKRDPKVTRDMLDSDFEYEVKMAKEGFGLLLGFLTRKIDPPNIMLVGFLTHIRNLYEFFYGSGNGDIAHADHYITSWNRVREPGLKDQNIKINIFLSHLRYSRRTANWGSWPIDLLYFSMRDATIDFFDKIDSSYKTEKLNNLSQNLQEEKIPKNPKTKG